MLQEEIIHENEDYNVVIENECLKSRSVKEKKRKKWELVTDIARSLPRETLRT